MKKTNKKHRCVEVGGCKAANCDEGLPASKSQLKRLSVQKTGSMDLYDKSIQADKDFKEWQILLISVLSVGGDLNDTLVKEYRRARTVRERCMKRILGDMCRE